MPCATISPISDVENPIFPADMLFIRPIVLAADASTALAACASPKVSSIIWAEKIAAMGLITFCPVYLGAEPPMG
jgi:hypothetical protein